MSRETRTKIPAGVSKVVNAVTGEVDKVENKKWGIKEYSNDGKTIIVSLEPIFSKDEAESFLSGSWYPDNAFLFCVDDEAKEGEL